MQSEPGIALARVISPSMHPFSQLPCLSLSPRSFAESMLYLQMISQDLSFFYCTKGSLFAKCGEEYKTKV